MYTATIHTAVRQVPLGKQESKEKAIEALQQAVYTLTEEDGRCRFVVSYFTEEVYSWEYQPTFRPDLKQKEEKKVEVKEEESKYEWNYILYVLKNGTELDYDNFYADGFGCPYEFDEEKSAHEFMKGRGYSKDEYRLVYEYCVWEKDKDWTCGCACGFTKKEARKNLNKNLVYYHLKLLVNGKVKEL